MTARLIERCSSAALPICSSVPSRARRTELAEPPAAPKPEVDVDPYAEDGEPGDEDAAWPPAAGAGVELLPPTDDSEGATSDEEGVETEWPETDGVESDGAETDGVETEGVETDGVLTEGVLTEGVGTEGVLTEGVVTEGVLTEGVDPTGVETDGVVTDGTDADGVETDGVLTDGVESVGVEADAEDTALTPKKRSETSAATPNGRLRTRVIACLELAPVLAFIRYSIACGGPRSPRGVD